MSRLGPRTLRSNMGAAKTKCAASAGGTIIVIVFQGIYLVNIDKTRATPVFMHIIPHGARNMWTYRKLTLAPDSGHIVAFCLSSTTSRAADSSSTALGDACRVA
jgi:hypothetical protein